MDHAKCGRLEFNISGAPSTRWLVAVVNWTEEGEEGELMVLSLILLFVVVWVVVG